jgi:biopolymer transport protein ExbD
MKGLLAQETDRRVLVKPSAGVAMQKTIAVLDSLATAGVTDLSLIADQAR